MEELKTMEQPNQVYEMPPTYIVVIYKSQKEIKGEIELVGSGKKIEFNPLNILSDLSYSEDKTPLPDEISASDYKYEYGFGKKIEIFDTEQYAYTAMCIKYLLKHIAESKTQNILKLNDIELLKSYCHITFRFFPLELCSNELEFSYNPIPSYPPAPSLVSAIDDFNFKSCQKFFYLCYFSADIIYSILHFLAFNEYKINRCSHCEKYFATDTNKQKYCSRNSPYPKYDHLNCESAVRNILQELTRKSRRIYKNLDKYYMPEHREKFYKAYDSKISEVKENPTIKNIESCLSILEKEKWYTKDSIRTVGAKLKKNEVDC